MIWEIVNPHDAYTIVAPAFLPAAAAVLLIGEGKYALTPVDNTFSMPLFLLGGSEPWLKEHFGDFGNWLKDPKFLAKTADALDSVMSFGPGERSAYELAIAMLPEDKRAEYRDKVHDKNRGSMSNLGKRAWQLAKLLRKKATVFAEVSA